MAASANPRARLEHILFHMQGVADTIGGISFDTYTSVYHMERTVERAVQIISEAVRTLPSEITVRYPEVEWVKIAGIGNILRHEYRTRRSGDHVGHRNYRIAEARNGSETNAG